MGQRIELPDGMTLTTGGNVKKKGFLTRFVQRTFTFIIYLFVFLVVLTMLTSIDIGNRIAVNMIDGVIDQVDDLDRSLSQGGPE